jgi:hypothetical protein
LVHDPPESVNLKTPPTPPPRSSVTYSVWTPLTVRKTKAKGLAPVLVGRPGSSVSVDAGEPVIGVPDPTVKSPGRVAFESA